MGASELSLEAISTFKLYISRHIRLDQTSKDFCNDLKLLGKRLCQLRPSMRPITNKVDLFLNSIPSCPNRNIDTLKKELLIIIDTIIQEAQNAKNKIQENAAKVLADLTCLLIHSYSSTLIHVLKNSNQKQFLSLSPVLYAKVSKPQKF